MAPYIVVDASVAGAWLFAEPFSLQAQRVAASIAARRVTALAPADSLRSCCAFAKRRRSPLQQGLQSHRIMRGFSFSM